MGERDQTFDVPLHADYRGEVSLLLVGQRADLWVRQRIKVGFDVVPKGAGKARRGSVDQHAKQDLTSAWRHNGRFLPVRNEADRRQLAIGERNQRHRTPARTWLCGREREVVRVTRIDPAARPCEGIESFVQSSYRQVGQHRAGRRTLRQMTGVTLSIWSGRLNLLRRSCYERVSVGVKACAEARHLESDQRTIAEFPKHPIHGQLSDGLEEVPNVHLHQPATAGMTLRGAYEVSTGRKRMARGVRLNRVQNVLGDPTLRPHQGRNGHTDRTITTWRRRAPSGLRALLHTKDAVRIYLTVNNSSERLRRDVDQVP